MRASPSVPPRGRRTKVGRSVQISLCGEISPALLEQAHPIPSHHPPTRPGPMPRPPPPAHHTLPRSTHAITRSHARSHQHVRILTHARLMPSCRCAMPRPSARQAPLRGSLTAARRNRQWTSASKPRRTSPRLPNECSSRRRVAGAWPARACAYCNGLSRFSVA